jgi:hypothetical protein
MSDNKWGHETSHSCPHGVQPGDYCEPCNGLGKVCPECGCGGVTTGGLLVCECPALVSPQVPAARGVFAAYCLTLSKAHPQQADLLVSVAREVRDILNAVQPVPDDLIGNLVDHWEMLSNDARHVLKEESLGFWAAMQRLMDWIEENR